MIVIVVNSKLFIDKSKLIIYIRVFVELYNWKNHRQVYKIYRIVELEKIYTLMAKYPYNLSTHYIVKLSLILHNAYIVLKDQEKVMFY